MQFELEFCDREPAKVTVIQDGPIANIWLRKDITEDTVDNGPDGTHYKIWRCNTLFFQRIGTPSAEEIEADFDAIAEQQIAGGRTVDERIGATEQAVADNGKQLETAFQALAELGDMIATAGGEA
jgi:hypothetical protein